MEKQIEPINLSFGPRTGLIPGLFFNPAMFSFRAIPDFILEAPGLSPTEKLTYVTMVQLADESGGYRATHQELSDKIRKSKRHTMRIVKDLEDKGFISKRDSGKTLTCYFVVHKSFFLIPEDISEADAPSEDIPRKSSKSKKASAKKSRQAKKEPGKKKISESESTGPAMAAKEGPQDADSDSGRLPESLPDMEKKGEASGAASDTEETKVPQASEGEISGTPINHQPSNTKHQTPNTKHQTPTIKHQTSNMIDPEQGDGTSDAPTLPPEVPVAAPEPEPAASEMPAPVPEKAETPPSAGPDREETASPPETPRDAAAADSPAEKKKPEKKEILESPEEMPAPLNHMVNLCKEIEALNKGDDMGFDPYRYTQKLLNKNYHPRAIRDALMEIAKLWRFTDDPGADGMKELERVRRKYYMTKTYRPMKNIWNRFMRKRAKGEDTEEVLPKEARRDISMPEMTPPKLEITPVTELPKKVPDVVDRLLSSCRDINEKNQARMDFDAYRFVQLALESGNHPEAVVEVLIKMWEIWGGVEPWSRLRDALEYRKRKYVFEEEDHYQARHIWDILMEKWGLGQDMLREKCEFPEDIPAMVMKLIDACYKVDAKNRGHMDFDTFKFVKQALTKKNHPTMIVDVLLGMADIWGSTPDPWERCLSGLRMRRKKSLPFTQIEQEVKEVWHHLFKVPGALDVLRELEWRKERKREERREAREQKAAERKQMMEKAKKNKEREKAGASRAAAEHAGPEPENGGGGDAGAPPPALPEELPLMVKTLMDLSRAVDRMNVGKRKNFEPHAFVHETLTKGYHPDIIMSVLRDVVRAWNVVDNPWSMAVNALTNRQDDRYTDLTEEDERVREVWDALMAQKAQGEGPLMPPMTKKKIPDPDLEGTGLTPNSPEAALNLLGMCQKAAEEMDKAGGKGPGDPYFFVLDALNRGCHPKVVVGVLLDSFARWGRLPLSIVRTTLNSRQRDCQDEMGEEDRRVVTLWNEMLRDRPRVERSEEDDWPEYDLSDIPLPDYFPKEAVTLLGLTLHLDILNERKPKGFDPFGFVQDALWEKNHPRAIIQVFIKLVGIWKVTEDPLTRAKTALAHRKALNEYAAMTDDESMIGDMWEVMLDSPDFIQAVSRRRIQEGDKIRKRKKKEKKKKELPDVVIRLTDVCRKLVRENNDRRDFDPYLFAREALNQGDHPEAVIHVLEKLIGIWGVAWDPWVKGSASLDRWRHTSEYVLDEEDKKIRLVWEELISGDSGELEKVLAELRRQEDIQERKDLERLAAARNAPLPPLPNPPPEILVRLADICARQYEMGKGRKHFDPYEFTREALEEGNHPDAVIHVIGKIMDIWKVAKEPWGKAKAALVRRQQEEMYSFSGEEMSLRDIWPVLIERPEIFERVTGKPFRPGAEGRPLGTDPDHVPEVVCRLAAACARMARLTSEDRPFNPHLFVQRALDERHHPEAIIHTLGKLRGIWDVANDPWEMGMTSLTRQQLVGKHVMTPEDEAIKNTWNDLRRTPEVFDALAERGGVGAEAADGDAAPKDGDGEPKEGDGEDLPASFEGYPPLPEELPEAAAELSRLCQALDRVNTGENRKDFDPFLFVQDALNAEWHPATVAEVLRRLAAGWGDIKEPWQAGNVSLSLVSSGQGFRVREVETREVWNNLMKRRKAFDALLMKLVPKSEMPEEEEGEE